MKTIRYVLAILFLLTGILHLVFPHRFPSLLQGSSSEKLLPAYITGCFEVGLSTYIWFTGVNKRVAFGILGFLWIYLVLVRLPQLWNYHYTMGLRLPSLLAEALSLALLLMLSTWVLLCKARPVERQGKS